jgi:hypothetical protein
VVVVGGFGLDSLQPAAPFSSGRPDIASDFRPFKIVTGLQK